jgi:hypothetical protein
MRKSQSPQSPQSPSRAQLQRRAYPENIPQDILSKLSNSVLGFSKEHDSKTILDNELIKNYLQVMSKVSGINRSFNSSLPFTTPPSWGNVSIINLNNLKINEAILRVLNMTIRERITTIILRGISFDTDKTRDKFLEFFSKNINLEKVILDDVKVYPLKINILLDILGTFKKLECLGISNCVLLDSAFNAFVNTLTNLKFLSYLSFTNNTITKQYYKSLFTENSDNTVGNATGINGNFNIYLYKIPRSNSWSMHINDLNGNNEWPNIRSLDVNIAENKMYKLVVVEENYKNVFAEKVFSNIEKKSTNT